jgi:hypothetical protein
VRPAELWGSAGLVTVLATFEAALQSFLSPMA